MARFLNTWHEMPCPEGDIAAVRGVLGLRRESKPGGVSADGPPLLLKGHPAEAVDIDRVLIVEARSLDRAGSLLADPQSIARVRMVQISDWLEV
jgi:hypothetical protein